MTVHRIKASQVTISDSTGEVLVLDGIVDAVLSMPRPVVELPTATYPTVTYSGVITSWKRVETRRDRRKRVRRAHRARIQRRGWR